MKWTKEQQNVIDFRNRDILVSAAAGSGKTAVLVERIIQRITDSRDPIDIDRLLVVTFTKAAAAEMRERIANAIEAACDKDPDNAHIRRQSALIHNAMITTIDSFCLFVVRNHFEEIDLDPNFRIADEGEVRLLEQDVLTAVFEECYEKERPEFTALLDAYAGKRNDQAVRDMVLKIYRMSLSSPWPEEWIHALSSPYRAETVEELFDTEIFKDIVKNVRLLLLDMRAQLQNAFTLAGDEDGPQAYAATIADDLSAFSGVESLEDYTAQQIFFDSLTFGKLPSIRKFTGDTVKKETVMSVRNEVKKEVESLRKKYFSLKPEDLLEQQKRLRPYAEELIRLTLSYTKAMEAAKRKKRILDFSDIEHFALKILVDEETKKPRQTASEFREHFKEIMIDEYQDSNQVQEDIMTAISRCADGQNNMFMVGDVKQSIYRFRQAKPELFMTKYNSFELKESKNQRIDLHKNFRSRKEVIDFCNDIFYKIMAPDLGKVSYDEDSALYCGAQFEEAAGMEPELILADLKDEGLADTLLDEDSKAVRIEALMTARRIQDLVAKGAKYSDIVILARSLSSWGAEFADVLKDCGIPAHVTSQMGYFSAYEVQIVLDMLKILDNPYQDIPMAAVLKSPIAGLDDEELAEIRVENKDETFSKGFAGILQKQGNEKKANQEQDKEKNEGKENDNDNDFKELSPALQKFVNTYRELRAAISDTPIHTLIEQLLDKTGFGDYVAAMPSGKRRQQNLEMLFEMAVNYESTSYKGLFHFVKYIETLQKYEVDFGEAETISENDDVVRIMTIHKSKGLEFPIVFVSGMGRKMNQRDTQDTLVLHPEQGLGLTQMLKRPRARIKHNTLIRSEIARQLKYENLGEELRVLYVALTRAKEKIILTGTVKDYGKTISRYTADIRPMKPISFGQRAQAQTYLDWILPAVLSYPDKYDITLKSGMDMAVREAEALASLEIDRDTLMKNILQVEPDSVEKISKNFTFEYKYKSDAARKSKYSVSEIKHDSMLQKYDSEKGEAQKPAFLIEEKESYIPSFISEKEKDGRGVSQGALRGTAVHRVMECFDFAGLYDVLKTVQNDHDYDYEADKNRIMKYVKNELARMLSQGLIDEDMNELINPDLICKFMGSHTARRMAEADKNRLLFREKPFVTDYDGALLQGIIDAFWIEEGRVIVLDYKTDKVKTAEELILRYKTQLDIYADALARIFDTDKSEELIYSFRLQEIIEIE